MGIGTEPVADAFGYFVRFLILPGLMAPQNAGGSREYSVRGNDRGQSLRREPLACEN